MLEVIEKRKALAPALEVDGSLGIEEIRAVYNQERSWWNEIKPDLREVEDLEVDGPLRAIPLRIYRPVGAAAPPTLIYLHGGGWVVGNLETHDRVMRLLCEGAQVNVVGIDYALSPEFKLPTAIEEVLHVWQWIQSSGPSRGLNGERIALGGDSAGANLSVAATQILHRSKVGAVKFLLLYYGAFGLSTSESWKEFGKPEYEFTWEEMVFYLNSYLGSENMRADPRYNVLAGDIDCLPPAFIAAAECDPLCDDSKALHDAMTASDRAAELKIYSGVLHGFIHYSRMLETASRALEDGAQALKNTLRTV